MVVQKDEEDGFIDQVLAVLSEFGEGPIDRSVVSIVPVTGGITNVLYKVSIDAVPKYIVRLFGRGTEEFIDRSKENVVFAHLSLLGLGPTFYGLFGNGRVEGYLEARAFTLDDMGDVELMPYVARALLQLHNNDIPQIRTTKMALWDKLELFFELSIGKVTFGSIFFILIFMFSVGARFESAEKQEVFDSLAVDNLYEDYKSYKCQIKKLHEILQWKMEDYDPNSSTVSYADEDSYEFLIGMSTDFARGMLYGLEQTLCHNDMLSGNILKDSSYNSISSHEVGSSIVHLIDYEYADYSYRGYDIANHFFGTLSNTVASVAQRFYCCEIIANNSYDH